MANDKDYTETERNMNEFFEYDEYYKKKNANSEKELEFLKIRKEYAEKVSKIKITNRNSGILRMAAEAGFMMMLHFIEEDIKEDWSNCPGGFNKENMLKLIQIYRDTNGQHKSVRWVEDHGYDSHLQRTISIYEKALKDFTELKNDR